MAEPNVSDGLGVHSSDFDDTAAKEREADKILDEHRRLGKLRKRKFEELEQTIADTGNKCRMIQGEKTALQNELSVLTASRDAEASSASLAQAECQRIREEKAALQAELATLRASRDAEATSAALAQDGWRMVREENAGLRAEIATMRASRNPSATSPTTQGRPEAPEEHTPPQRVMEEPEMATVSLPIQALKGKDSSGTLVCLEIADLGALLQRDLSRLVPEWQTIAKRKWKRKTWDEMTKAILAAPNQCALDKVDNTGACLWTHDDRQLFACRKSANNGRYCLRPHNKSLLLLPLPPAARESDDPTQPGYYRIETPGTLYTNKELWGLWESNLKG
ncbi:hypothetical protein KC363_g7255 [Hortaea werneckii]|nr:hypothetical protein KC363_g7255 [Hortaea werneckii]